MRQLRSHLSANGNLELPQEIQRILGLEPADSVVFLIEGDQVRLERAPAVVQATAGIFRPEGVAHSAVEVRSETEVAIALETQRRGSCPPS